MKIKFITLTCEKYHNSRVTKIRETWGKGQDITFLSDTTIEPDIVGYDYLPKGYENIYYKYIEFLKRYSNLSYDWYFFTDDDTWVNIDNVTNVLSEYNCEDSICIGSVCILNSDATDRNGNHTGFPLDTITGNGTSLPLTYVSGGAGFILSAKTMKSIIHYLNNTNDIPRCYSSDVTIGFWLRNCGIICTNNERFWGTNPKVLDHTEDDIKKNCTYHYVDEKMMNELFDISENK